MPLTLDCLGRNGWTGGQYSLYRFIFGVYLFLHFWQLIAWAPELFSNRGVLPDGSVSPLVRAFPNVLALWDTPLATLTFVGAATVLSALFAVGRWDRFAAVAIWYISACLFGRNPLTSNPGLPYIGLLLVVHALIPGKPYGALDSAGRTDPRGGWRLPPAYFFVVWVLMAVGYSYSGYTKLVSPSWIDGSAIAKVLDNPLARPGPVRDLMLASPDWMLRLVTWSALALELAFAPLALWRVTRPFVWGLMLLMHLNLMAVIDFADLTLGLVMLHLFTFDPAWIRPRFAGTTDRIFFDGHCGLCHRFIRFILAEDRAGDSFVFSPLQGETIKQLLTPEQRRDLPDSVVLLTADGRLLTRSAAALHALSRLGGAWRPLAAVLRAIPAPLRDLIYNAVAAVRHRISGRPSEACPLLPPDLRQRFEF